MNVQAPTFSAGYEPTSSTAFETKSLNNDGNAVKAVSDNSERTAKVKRVVGAILLVLGALLVAAGVAALVLPPVGVAVGLAGSALLAVAISFIGGGFVLGSVGSFLLGNRVHTPKAIVLVEQAPKKNVEDNDDLFVSHDISRTERELTSTYKAD